MMSEKNKSMVSSSVVGSRVHEIGPDVIQRASVKQRQRISKANLDTAELTVDCVLGEMLHGGTRTNRPTMDAQLYLQRRVSEIVKQIESTSSAHHFCRHVVEIDELLRCDAPMGFTPSMVLVGIPDILYMLSDAVKQGYLLYPAGENGAVQALSPVRKSPITKMSIAAKTATTTALQTAITAAALPATAPPGGNRAERKQHGRSLASPRNSARSKLKGGAVKDDISSTDLLPFLPPLVRRPVSPPQEQQRSETMPHGNARDGVADSAADITTTTTTTAGAGGAPAAAAVIASNSDPCRHTTQRTHSKDKLSGAPLVGKGQLNHKSLQSRKEGRTGKQLGGTNSGTALPQYSSSPTGTVEKQQLVVQYGQGLDESLSLSHVPLLRDIPSALQALLYHCALPLVCLTPEDHQQRTTAIRVLASAMASMLRITENSVPANSIKTPPSNEKGITDKKEEKDTSDMVEDDRENNDNKVASRLPFQEISFRIRYAALMSLNALMSLIDSEELTCVNQHFASRDRVRYEKSDAATLPHTPERNYLTASQKKSGYQKKSTHEKEIPLFLHSNSEKTIAESSPARVFRLTDPFLSTPQRSPRRGRAHPTFPVSIYNGAVAVDVFIPLLERWTDILQDCVSGDALFDSSRQFFRHPAIEEAEAAEEKKRNENNNKKQNTIIVLDMDLNEGRNNHHSTEKKMGGFTVSVSKTRMDEKTAEEVYLLLCACLHLSTYKQHARYLIGPDKSPDSTYKSLPVLLSLTMARCAEGDKFLSLCVECLWNLLEIAPEETVGALLHHTTTTSDDSSDRTKNGENEKSRKERTLSSLSAMESLLFSFLHTLMLGHRLRQREVRNDMVVLFMMILKTHTTVLQNRQEMVQNSSDFEAVTFQVPKSTIYAINVIARTIFDLVCGPELRVYGITAKMTREPVETFLRYHSALCPTTRVENVQFKLLSWRMLETFYQWQNARFTLENVCRECQGTRTNSRRVDASENSGLVDGTVNYNDDDCDSLFFDVCSHGFINVLLLYVDTTCSDELVVTWTREELFTLQEEVWYILLGLIESAVIPSSSSFQESNNNNNNSCSSSMRKRNIDGMSLTNSDRSKENMMNDNSNGELPLVRADIQFVASRGIPCALRYIREVTAKDADDLVCLAVRVLSVLSRCPSYRSQLLDATVPTAPSASSYNENVPCIMEVIFQVIQNCLQKRPPPTEVMNLYTCTNLVKTSKGSNFSSQVSHVTTITSTQSGSTVNNNNNNNNNNSGSQVAIRNKKSKGLQQKSHDDPLTQLPSTQGGLKCTFESDSCSENKFLTAREYDVIMYCLSLLNNIANGNSYDISLMHQSFVSLGGVPLLISMAQISLSLLTLALQSPLKGNNSRNGLLLSVLDSFRAFILGNEVAQKQFVYEDGVHVILSAILTLESRWKNDYLNVLNGNTADSNSPLAFMLTILADLLRESKEAQEEFLKWSTHDLSMSMGMEDNTCTNATQLLLRMWIEKEEEIEGDEKGMTCNGEIEYEQNGEHDEFDSATGNESEGTKNGARPILHADRWGLGLLGIRHRNSVIAELQNRYNKLECTDLDAVDDRTARDETTQLARRRLAVSLQNILGMHAKVYACLAAIGFDRLINVKTTPLERVKLLHVAALPSLCEDEVWGAMAETVNLRGHAVVLPMRRNEKKQVNGAAKDDKEEDDEGASKERFVVDPIIPDATQLVKVLLDVEARTMELQHLAKICIDTHAAHQSEITQRFLLSRLKLGSGDTSVMTLVQHARSRYDPVSTGEGGSILDHVMPRTRQSGVERTDISSAFSTTPTGTAMVDTGKFFSSRITLLEKRRKRNDMIQKSFRESQGGVIKGSNTVKTDM